MSDNPMKTIEALLGEGHLADRFDKIEDGRIELRYGSALVVLSASDKAVYVSSPMFEQPPEGKEDQFFRQILALNSVMAGFAAFALEPDDWVVLQAARPLEGLRADELSAVIDTVGELADRYDDKLFQWFYAPTPSGEVVIEERADLDAPLDPADSSPDTGTDASAST